MGKKKYIAIIVFILLGLSIFAFAGSDNELEDKTQNGDKQQETSGNNTDNKNDDVVDNNNDNTANNKTNNVTNNKVNANTTTNNTNTTENNNAVDNSYDLALEAVKKLESTLLTKIIIVLVH